jgi:hypothetical protein
MPELPLDELEVPAPELLEDPPDELLDELLGEPLDELLLPSSSSPPFGSGLRPSGVSLQAALSPLRPKPTTARRANEKPERRTRGREKSTEIGMDLGVSRVRRTRTFFGRHRLFGKRCRGRVGGF